jgi:hypothetical protein
MKTQIRSLSELCEFIEQVKIEALRKEEKIKLDDSYDSDKV